MMADPMTSGRDDRNSMDLVSAKDSGTTALPDSSAATVDTGIVGDQNVSVRAVVGGTMHGFSQVVNDNLIAARYGVMASIFLLTAYGLSNTPLFFRFRTVSEIPASYFVGRRKLYGRIIGVDVDESRQSIHLTVRHLSPVGQILPKTWFDFFMRFSPLAGRLAHNRSKQKPEETKTELLRVQIAGIQSPPVSGLSYRPEEWLEKLAKQRALVSCQVLARQVFLDPGIKEYSKPPKRIMADVLPGLKDYESSKERKMIVEAMKNKDDQTAVCRITYRPSLFQFFPSDVAEALIKGGNASVSSSLFTNNNSLVEETTTGIRKTKALDASQRIQDLRKDVHYLDRLTKSEFEAAKASIGMWSVPEVRASKQEVVEEVEFQTKANPFQKLWRWFRG